MDKVQLQKFSYRGTTSTLGQRFSDWLEMFDLAVAANGIKVEQMKAYFLMNIGEDLLDIYRSKRKDEKMAYEDIRNMLVDHIKPKTVVFTERAIFRRAKRHEGEPVNDFATRLRILARYCGYKDAQLEEEILQQFVSGIGNHAVEMKICSLEVPTLEKAIETAITAETLDANVKGLHGPTDREISKRGLNRLAEEEQAEEESINHLGHGQRGSGQTQRGGQRHGAPDNKYNRQSQQSGQQNCGNCGYAKHQSADQCPASGKTCRICQKANHFSRVCRSEKAKQMKNGTAGAFGGAGANQGRRQGSAQPPPKKFHQITKEEKKFEVDEQQYSEFVRYMQANQWMGVVKRKVESRLNDGPRRTYRLLGTEVDCLVDTGAPINVIDEVTFKSLSPQPKLETCNTRYFPYGEDIAKPIPIIGQFVANMNYKGRSLSAGFVVVKGQEERLMSYRTAVELGIITMDDDRTILNMGKSGDASRTTKPEAAEADILKLFPPPKGLDGKYTKEEFKEMFPDLFSGKLGCLKDVRVHLELDPSVKPVRQKLRPLPFHLREMVSKEIKKQIDMKILERVTDDMGPTPWVANIVPVRKGDNEVRIVVDNRAQNKAIRRTHYPTKTIEELIYEMNGATIFSKLDIIKAFHQFMLEEAQRYLTTITTHEGLLRYTRLHMGISCASEVFTEHIRRILEGIIGQVNMTDDVVIQGSTEENHQRSLLTVLKRLQDNGLTLNLEKCEFYKSEITFYGLRFTKDGVSPTADRVKALKECKEPTDVKALRSFLCTVIWSSRFILNLCTLAEPLWRLTKDKVPWQWTDLEQRAFDAIKEAIEMKCVGYFRKDWETEAISDASPVGLGGVICQYNPIDPAQRHIVCIVSRLLTDVERRYSQVEKEALGVVWLCERAYIYLIGHRFRIVVDNRAVMLIYGNSKSKPPARIERWALRLTPFDFEIVHRPGN